MSTASTEFARLLDLAAMRRNGDGGVQQDGGDAERVAVGVEAEYVVRDRADAAVDFRGVIGGLGAGPPGLDPGDVNARRLASGTALTCDLGEAELAVRAERLGPGFAARVSARLSSDEAALARAVSPLFSLHGYTTHVSVSVERRLVEEVAWTYAETFGPAAMLMMDGRTSPGLLVRPRAGGRVELCGWYLSAEVRRGALAFAAGSILACVGAVLRRESSQLPPPVVGAIEPGAARHGWYLDRTAFGSDLYHLGRAAMIPRREGRAVTAQEHLESCWSAARGALSEHAPAVECADAQAMVDCEAPLASELPGAMVPIRTDPSVPSLAMSDLARPRRRGWFDLATVALTWGFALFVITDSGRTRRAYAVVPANRLQTFATELDAGRLDSVIRAYLRVPPAPRLLALPEQTEVAGLYDELVDRVNLLWPETEPGGTFAALAT